MMHYGSASGGSMVGLELFGWDANAQGSLRCAWPGIETTVSENRHQEPSFSCLSPPGNPGEAHVQITASGGLTFASGNGSDSNKFTFHSVGIVDSVSPTAGPTSGGTEINIKGRDFPPPSDLQNSECRFTTPLQVSKSTLALAPDGKTMKCITNPTQQSVASLAYTLNGEDWTDLPMAKFKFNPCGKGFFSPSYNLKCKPCSTAKYQDKVDSQSCIDCSNKQYANSTGSTACSDCPVNTFVPGEANKRENSTNCECLPNYYLPDTTQLEFLEAGGNITLQTKLRGFECVSCDDFNLIETAVICPGGPSQPQPQLGYWIDPFDPSIVRSCPIRRSCTGAWRVCDNADKAAGCKGYFPVCKILQG
jgi:hypothetical protein